MQSSTLIRQLTEQPLVRDLSIEAAQAVLALRYCILCRRSERDPMPNSRRRWGNILAARRYRLVVEAIGHIWPEPFAVAPPCCPRVSFDEALLAAVVGAPPRGDRVRFDWLTAEDARRRRARDAVRRARKFHSREGAGTGLTAGGLGGGERDSRSPLSSSRT